MAWPVHQKLEPVGTGQHVVTDGECMTSIAELHGFRWETLWDAPENKDLRTARGDPYVLMEGDRVFIPELRPKMEKGASGQLHTFRRRGVPEKLRVRLSGDDAPQANLDYQLVYGKVERQGTTDDNGQLEEWIPNGLRDATLRLADGRTFRLAVGRLDPVQGSDGAAARLRALGFLGASGRIRKALMAFQLAHGLSETGELDESTCDKLREQYGG